MNYNDGISLVRAARSFVVNHISDKADNIQELQIDYPFGIFVTLKIQGDLRGCIGYIESDRKLFPTLKDAAICAATKDPRFDPVKLNELDDIIFEVTILNAPQIIKVSDTKQYLTEIIIGRDGLIIRKDNHNGVLLPQVPVELNWNVKEFLEHACQKAQLDKDCWLKKDTIIEKFQGTIFKEKTPNGEIIKETLGD